MENKFLNSIVQAKSPLIGGPIIEYQRDILYFIRTSEENGEEGFLYLNGKKYGNVSEIYERIKTIEAELSGISSGISYTEVIERLKKDEVIINQSKDAIEDLDIRVSDVEEEASANTIAINVLNGDETIKGSVDQKIKDAIDNLPADMFVEKGEIIESGDVTYLVLTIKGQKEPLYIDATKLVDTYKSGDAYIEVKDYKISLNIDKVKEALDLSKYATKEETEKITNKVNEVISSLTEVQESVEGISEDIANLSAQTESVQKTATKALETAQSAETSAIKAQETADDAFETAQSAETLAVKAQETADQAESDIVVLSGNVVDNQSDIDSLEDEVDELSGEIATINEKVETLSSDVKTISEEVEDINTTISGMQSDIEEISAATSGSQETIKILSATLITLSSETIVNTENITTISGDVITLSGEVISNQENIKLVEENVENILDEVSAITSNIETLSANTENNTKDIQTISGDVTTLSSSVITTNENLDELSASVISNEERITDAESALTEVITAVAILNSDENTEGSVDQKIKDAIDNLPADMFVESGRIEKSGDTEYLVLKIKGQEQELYIDATALVDTYTNGDEYVKVENYKISLNIDALKKALGIDNLATKEELEDVIDKLNDTISGLTEVQDSVEELSERVDELSAKTITLEPGTGIEISGSSISANTNATTTEDIQVTVDLGAGFTKGTTIPSGTSVQDLLVKLLSKELWATSVATGKTFSASVGKPTATLDKSGTVEVGTVVTFNSTASTAYTSAQTVTAKTMTYGYYDGSKTATLNTATTYTETLKPTKSGDIILATTYAGFDNVTAEIVTATSITVTGLTVVEGSNSATVKETGATVYAQTNVTEKTLYVATNLKNTTKSATDSSDWTVTIPATWNGTESIPTSNNNSVSITGAYKYYYGFAPMGLANTLDNLTDAQIYAMGNGWITKDGTTTLVANDSAKAVLAGGNIVIAVPSKYKLASILEKLSGNSILENFKSEKRTLNIGGTSTTEYTVYYYSVAAAPTYYNVTITKA